MEAADGRVRGGAAQRRRLALMALLACARRPLSRDKLIGYLWPEYPAERARRLLSEAVYVLRRSLGDGVIEATSDELALASDAVWCDATEFEKACGQGDLGRAVELYGGPFLDGFFISDASAFEHWLDGERARLNDLYTDALARHALATENSGEGVAAVALWRRLCHQDRFNATYAIALMRCLDAAGDRAGALGHARTHAALLREEFGAEPDPAVTAFAERLRSLPPPSSPDPTPRVREIPVDAGATPILEPAPARQDPVIARPAGAAPEPAAATVAVPARRSRRTLVLAVSALIALTLISALLVRNREVGPVATIGESSTTLVILPFQVRGGADLQSLGPGAAAVLSTSLDGVGSIRVLDHHLVQREAQGRSLDPRAAGALARRHGMRWFVLGDVIELGQDVRITAQLYEAGSDTPSYRTQAEGAQPELARLFHALTRDLIVGLVADSTRALTLEAINSAPLPALSALKAWLIGDSAYRAAQYPLAISALQRAVREHPDYALAHYRLSTALEWNFEYARARAAAGEALRLSDQLTPRYAQLVAAWYDFVHGRADAAERRYQALLDSNDADLEARVGLGEVLVHYNPVRGRPVREAQPLLEGALAADPSYGEVRYHLLELAAQARDRAAFDALLPGIDASTQQAPAWQAVRDFLWGDAEAQRRVLLLLATRDELSIGLAAARVAAHARDFEGARRIASLLLEPGRSASYRVAGQMLIALLDLAEGNRARALARLDSAAAREPAWALELRALAALHPVGDVATARETRDLLEAWRPGVRNPEGSFFLAAHLDVHSLLRLYLLSALSSRAGEPDAAARWLHDLERLNVAPAHRRFAAALATSASARRRLLLGDSTRALHLLRDIEFEAEPERIATSPFFARALDRLLLADLLYLRGDTAQAARWYGSLTEGYDFAFVAVARARLQQVRDAAPAAATGPAAPGVAPAALLEASPSR